LPFFSEIFGFFLILCKAYLSFWVAKGDTATPLVIKHGTLQKLKV
jgi:hypothetical protein